MRIGPVSCQRSKTGTGARRVSFVAPNTCLHLLESLCSAGECASQLCTSQTNSELSEQAARGLRSLAAARATRGVWCCDLRAGHYVINAHRRRHDAPAGSSLPRYRPYGRHSIADRRTISVPTYAGEMTSADLHHGDTDCPHWFCFSFGHSATGSLRSMPADHLHARTVSS